MGSLVLSGNRNTVNIHTMVVMRVNTSLQHPLVVALVLMVTIISTSMAAPIEIVAPETLPDNCRLETITIQEEVKDTHVEKVVCETEFRPSCTIRDVTECRNVSRPLCTVEERKKWRYVVIYQSMIVIWSKKKHVKRKERMLLRSVRKRKLRIVRSFLTRNVIK